MREYLKFLFFGYWNDPFSNLAGYRIALAINWCMILIIVFCLLSILRFLTEG
jgi:hypothetical protein